MLPFWKGEYNKYSSCVVERVAWKEGNWNTHVIFKNHRFCFLEIWNINCNDGKKNKSYLPYHFLNGIYMYFSFLFHISDIIMKLILISYQSANTLTFLWFFSCLTFAQEPVYQCSKALQFTYTCISITVTCTCTTAFSPIQKLLWTKCKPDWCLKKIGVKM